MQGSDGAVADDVVAPSDGPATDAPGDPVAQHVQRTPETLVAEFTIEHEDLVLAPTLSVTAVTIDPDGPVTGGPGVRYLFFTARGDDLDDFEDVLAADHTLDDVTVMGQFDDHRVYRALLAAGTLTVSSVLPGLGARILEIESTADAWLFRVQLPDRGTLATFRQHCLEEDVTFSVRRLVKPDDGGVDSRTGLNDHQRETLLAAFASGYYDVPRAISQEELAEQLGISPSAISQRLRTAVGRLLEETIAPE